MGDSRAVEVGNLNGDWHWLSRSDRYSRSQSFTSSRDQQTLRTSYTNASIPSHYQRVLYVLTATAITQRVHGGLSRQLVGHRQHTVDRDIPQPTATLLQCWTQSLLCGTSDLHAAHVTSLLHCALATFNHGPRRSSSCLSSAEGVPWCFVTCPHIIFPQLATVVHYTLRCNLLSPAPHA